jgi:hypothetical protein
MTVDLKGIMPNVEMKSFDNDAYVKGGEDPNANKISKKDPEAAPPSRYANLSDEETKQLKRGILKNVIVISIAFMLLFTAFQSMASLQSSLNKVQITNVHS